MTTALFDLARAGIEVLDDLNLVDVDQGESLTQAIFVLEEFNIRVKVVENTNGKSLPSLDFSPGYGFVMDPKNEERIKEKIGLVIKAFKQATAKQDQCDIYCMGLCHTPDDVYRGLFTRPKK